MTDEPLNLEESLDDIDPSQLADGQPSDESEPSPESMITSFVDDFVAALINSRIYWTAHPCVLASISDVVRQVQEICAAESADSITIGVTRDFLVFEDRPLLGASLGAKRLIKALQDWQSGGVRIMVDVAAEDFEVFLDSVHDNRDPDDDFRLINEKLKARGTPQQIELLPKYKDLGSGASSESTERDQAEARRLSVPMHLYQSVMGLLEGITVNVSTGGRIDFAPVQEHAETMLKRLERNEGPLVSLARQDQYDAFTFGHSVRVSVLALNFGRALTQDSEMLVRLGTAALLHDVGKCMVPFEILHSRNQLSPEEREEISRHSEYGAQILLDHAEADPYAIAATFGHHCAHGERGYPKTLHEHKLSRITEIVGIVDVFEALTAARPYKRAMSPIRAYRIMMGMRDRFDQRLLRRFIEVNGIFPSGQLVELSTGEKAKVLSQTADICLPDVCVLTDADGNVLHQEDQWELDMSQHRTAEPVKIYQQLPDDAAVFA